MKTTRQQRFDTALAKMIALLKGPKPLHAMSLAKRLGCAVPSVYSRVDALRVLGHKVMEAPDPAHSKAKPGPIPLVYWIEKS